MMWGGLIYLLSSQSNLPGFDVGMADYIFKKLSHMTVYAGFYFLLHRAVNMDNKSIKTNWYAPFILTFLYASSDEIHQIFTPKRTPSPIDVGFDMIGASIAFLRIYGYI